MNFTLSLHRWLLLSVITIALLFQFLSTTVLREFYVGDEGFYGTVALNMEHSWYYWLHPTQVPEGTFDTERARLGHPCIHCMFMALSSYLFGGGIIPFQLFPMASFALTLYFIYRLLSLWDELAGRYALLLAAISPVILSEFSLLQAEPLMAAFGISGLYFAVLGILQGKVWGARLAGACFGLAFLTKLWLSFPYPFAAAIAVIILSRLKDQCYLWLIRYLVLMASYFVLVSLLHLLSVALWTPGDLAFWIKDVYLSLFAGEGVQATKLQGTSPDLPANWAHPFWYYFAITYRNHFFLFPLIAMGAPYLTRYVYPAFSWIGPGIASILLLSVFAIKSSLYVLSSTLFIYALAGLCVAALLFQAERRPLPWNWWSWVVTIGLLILLIGVLLSPIHLTIGYKIFHTLVMLLLLGAMMALSSKNYHRRTETLLLTGTLTLFALFLTGNLSSRYPTDRVVAEIMAPYVKDRPPNQVAFIAPNFKSFQLYLFKRGRYWKDTPFSQPPEAFFKEMQQNGIHLFIMGPEEWQNPALAPLFNYLSCDANEITDQFRERSGHTLDRRVFVHEQK